MRKQRHVVYMAILTAIAICLLRFQMADRDAVVAAEITASSPAPVVRPASAPKKVVYNYSVIPGGEPNVADFCGQIQSDAAFHGFNCNVAYETSLRSPISVFMTFKKNGRIYWTKHPVSVKAGELMYTDGHRSFLARCGNEIGFAPQQPTMEIDESLLSEPTLPASPPVLALAPSGSSVAPGDFVPRPPSVPTGVPAYVAPDVASVSSPARSGFSPAWLATAAAVPLLIWHGGGGNQSPAVPPPPKCDSIEFGCSN
jgi:hypothetical protein